jgi:hypothetical protein
MERDWGAAGVDGQRYSHECQQRHLKGRNKEAKTERDVDTCKRQHACNTPCACMATVVLMMMGTTCGSDATHAADGAGGVRGRGGWVLVGVVSFFFVVLWCVRVCFVELEGVGRLTSRSSPVFSSFDIS